LILALPAHAKLNLSLAVHGLRPDGHHEVTTVLQAVSLHDLVVVEPHSETELVGGHPDDLVLRAQAALERAAGRRLPARISLVKRIPVGAGLAGGSSDAGTTLRALQILYGLPPDLHEVAVGLGADVPFFLYGGTMEAGGRGERLVPLAPGPAWFALAWPGIEISTQAVYRRWDEVGGDGANHLTRAAFSVAPALEEFAGRLPGWTMTGSGGAFFKPCATRQEAERAVFQLDCWTGIATPVAAWAAPS
jgi:4-diphosphocytidyl-2-C-methyl-D-erythritol kinase